MAKIKNSKRMLSELGNTSIESLVALCHESGHNAKHHKQPPASNTENTTFQSPNV